MTTPDNTKSDKKKSITKQTKDKFWQIRVSEGLDDRLEEFLDEKGIRNKSEFIRTLVVIYMDLYTLDRKSDMGSLIDKFLVDDE